MGGKRYCKESELTRCRLLAYERSQGRISECVQLVRVTVTTLDGKTTTHTLDSEHHEVRDLKNHVGEKHGLECAKKEANASDFLKMFRAGLFVVGRGGFSRTIELMRTHCKLPCVRIPEITANYEYSRAEQRRPATRNHNHNRRTPDGPDMDST